jgi:hypothetical protein
MTDNWRPELDRWLDVEQHGTDEAADAAFASLFRAVPPRAPSSAFAGRVMEAVGRVDRFWPVWTESWWLRGALAASMLLTGMAAAGVAPAALAGSGLLWVTRGLGAGAWLLGLLLSAFKAGLEVWGVLAGVGQTALLVLQTTPVCLFVVVNLMVTAASFAALRRLLGQQEGTA